MKGLPCREESGREGVLGFFRERERPIRGRERKTEF